MRQVGEGGVRAGGIGGGRVARIAAPLPTSAFVLLWSSGAIVSEIGLQHGSPFALLIFRYGVAFAILVAVALWRGQVLPAPGTRLRNGVTGTLMAGVYSSTYLLALDHGVTPGALATLLGVQPIITIFLTERRASWLRWIGLLCALAGLALVVSDGLMSTRMSTLGLLFAGLSLAGITAGSILQKRETQEPWAILPLQYAAGLAFAAYVAPMQPFHFNADAGFILSVLWLGIVIGVGTTFLLYTLIARGNLVNVTSLFYLVPGVTAAMDWMWLGNPMSAEAMGGLALIVAGLVLVFRQPSR